MIKSPRFYLQLELSIDEYLNLLAAVRGKGKAEKQTIRKIAAFEKRFWNGYQIYKERRREYLKLKTHRERHAEAAAAEAAKNVELA